MERGRKLFEKLIGQRNDVGLFSEEYDPAQTDSWETSRRPFPTSHLSMPPDAASH